MSKMFMATGSVPRNPALWPQEFWAIATDAWQAFGADDVAISPQAVYGEDGGGMCLLSAMPVKFEIGNDGHDKFIGLCATVIDADNHYRQEELN